METVSKEQFDYIQAKHSRLVRKVQKMREYQRLFATFKSSSYLKNAKRYEHEVDAILKDELKQEKQTSQGNLF